jgi:hypothetical protein
MTEKGLRGLIRLRGLRSKEIKNSRPQDLLTSLLSISSSQIFLAKKPYSVYED